MAHKIGYSIYGAVIGLVCRRVFPGGEHLGLIMPMLVGVAGAFLGVYICRNSNYTNWLHPTKPPDFLAALVWAVFLLAVYSQILVRWG